MVGGGGQLLAVMHLLASREAGERLQQLYEQREQNSALAEKEAVLTIDYTEPAPE